MPGIVIYIRIDGGFSVWDTARNYWRKDPGRPAAYHFQAANAWEGLDVGSERPCEGLERDWVSWQEGGKPQFEVLRRVLEILSPIDEPLRPGRSSRTSIQTKMICTSCRATVGKSHSREDIGQSKATRLVGSCRTCLVCSRHDRWRRNLPSRLRKRSCAERPSYPPDWTPKNASTPSYNVFFQSTTHSGLAGYWTGSARLADPAADKDPVDDWRTSSPQTARFRPEGNKSGERIEARSMRTLANRGTGRVGGGW